MLYKRLKFWDDTKFKILNRFVKNCVLPMAKLNLKH